MAKTDMSKIRAAYERVLNPKASSGDSIWYKPENGDQIRILPASDGEPLKPYHIHYGIDGLPFACPKRNFRKECPVCEFAQKLYDSEDLEEKEAAKDFWPSLRHHSIVVVRGKEEEGPKIWGYSKTVYLQLAGAMLDADYGDIADLEAGNDIKISVIQNKGQKWATTSANVRPKKTHLAEKLDGSELSEEVMTKLIEGQPIISEHIAKLTTEEIKDRLTGHLAPKDDDGSSAKQIEVNTQKEGKLSDVDKFLND